MISVRYPPNRALLNLNSEKGQSGTEPKPKVNRLVFSDAGCGDAMAENDLQKAFPENNIITIRFSLIYTDTNYSLH